MDIQPKALVSSWTFWFGLLQVLLGGVGLVSGLMDQQTSFALIITGMGAIGLRLKTEAPIGAITKAGL